MMTIMDRNELKLMRTICKDLSVTVDERLMTRVDREGWVETIGTELIFRDLTEMDIVVDLYNEMKKAS